MMAATVASVTFGQLKPYGPNVTLDKCIILGSFCFRALGGLNQEPNQIPETGVFPKKKKDGLCVIVDPVKKSLP